jgi:hypothetical protein
LRCAFLVALPACVPGTVGVLRVQAIGVPLAPPRLLAAWRAACHRQGTPRFQALAFPGGAPLHRRSCRVTADHTEGLEADDAVGSLLDRRTQALPRRITTVGSGDIAGRQGARRERCARVDIADAHREQRQGHQVQRAREALIGAGGAGGLQAAGVKHHQAPPRGQGLHGGQGAHRR